MTRRIYESRMLQRYNRFLRKCAKEYGDDGSIEENEDTFQNVCLCFVEWLRNTCKTSLGLSPFDGNEFRYIVRDYLREKRVQNKGLGFHEHKTAQKHTTSATLYEQDFNRPIQENLMPTEEMIIENDFIGTLLPREQNIVELMLGGFDEKSAAEALCRGYSSVRRDLGNIRQKYNQYFKEVAAS